MDIQLGVNAIFEKDFKTAFRGYDREEVDEFLDVIIQDYKVFQERIAALEAEVKNYREKERQMPKKEPVVEQTTGVPTNFDILKRISNLEKHVFGDKLSNE